ncbi:MAG: tripartite tricarboxylate transporter TctB family protein [Deltaproteobacteria bacterium]|nr:tripartite tricarboxylate transporter TctB family protein [Deltaproteobacteria bacterium]MBW1962127.1 tripartite tricarboxylate transporter TctB family protein [Deltaproteobacteria bacterium]MBW1993609.1 tripartite tricarboxylate transporter TctB family protein [Deltaproteobacteria bacterium]MBW2152971.1 tripartite tricarboxylate transporter TctB family protein [Deltaproteobacteria bacterium]
MIRWWKSNQGIGVIMTFLFVVLLIYIQMSPWAHRKLRDGFTLGFFPAVAVILLVVFSLILIFDSRRKQVPDRIETLTFKYFMSTAAAVIFCLIYFRAMITFGFLITTPLFLISSMYVLGIKSLRSLITSSLLMTAIVYSIFRIMGIRLPPIGLLGV